MKALVFLKLVGVALGVFVGFASAEDKVDEEVYAHLETHDSVRVVAQFHVSADAAPLSSQGRKPSITEVRQRILAETIGDAEVHHRFELVRALVLEADTATLERLNADPRIRAVSLDPPGSGGMSTAGPLLGFDQIHDPDEFGLTGTDVRVAVVDSGIDASHPDFAGKLVDEACFCANSPESQGCCPSGQTTQFGSGAAADHHGHGTWVTGILAGRGTVAPTGAAPDAEIVSVRVLDKNNRFCCTSDIAAAFEWLALEHPELAVVNASLQTAALFPTACDDLGAWQLALSDAVAALEANGTLVVGISGNQASDSELVAPGCIDQVVAIGATYADDYGTVDLSGLYGCTDSDARADQVTCFSNSSPEVDVLAPGAFLQTAFPGTGSAGGLSGTSFAAPLVAGCAALLREASDALSPTALRQALRTSPVRVTDPRNGLVRPRLDCVAALTAALDAASGLAINYGMSGSWYNPATSGQGFLVDVIIGRDPPHLAAYWFTHGTQAGGPEGQRWYLAQGDFHPGDSTAELTLFQTTGGVLDRSPPEPDTVPVGSARLSFQDCTTAAFDYSMEVEGEALEGTIPLRRLSADVLCEDLAGE